VNIVGLAIIAIVIGCISYFVMGRWVDKNIVKPDPNAEMPAVKFKGREHHPQHPLLLMGYHWAAICGPAPIIGAIIAVIYGWLPALIWLSVAILFMGGFHDYLASIISVRTGGKSVADLAGTFLSGPSKVMFSLIGWFISILVLGVFPIMFGHVFEMMPEQPPIAIYFTIIAAIIGYMMYKRGVGLGKAVAVGIALYALAIWGGIAWPWVASWNVWFWVLIIYAFVVAVLPITHVEAPRGALNAIIMGAGMLFLFIGVFTTGIVKPDALTITLPMWTGFMQTAPGPGPLWPMVAIVATCGAVAGFHALVSSTVTAHQLSNETHARKIVWGSMSLEYGIGVWGIMAACTIAVPVYLKQIAISPLPMYGIGSANIVSGFGMNPALIATMFMVILVAFMTTSLDTIARVGRYMLQGLTTLMPPGGKKVFGNVYFATVLTVGVGAGLGSTGTVMTLWPMVGVAIQAVAVLTFAIITGYLLIYKKPHIPAVVPFIFLAVTVAGAGGWLGYFHATLGHWPTSIMAFIGVGVEIAFTVLFARRWNIYKSCNSIEELEEKLGTANV